MSALRDMENDVTDTSVALMNIVALAELAAELIRELHIERHDEIARKDRDRAAAIADAITLTGEQALKQVDRLNALLNGLILAEGTPS